MVKTALILGAGRVSAPCIDYLVRKGNCEVVVADIAEENVNTALRLFPNIIAIKEDAGNKAAELIDRYSADVVINLLPPEFMPSVSNICMEKKVHMVHPAYLDESTKKMAKEIESAGVVFIVELGLDPGIDHMCAAKTIDEIHENGGKIDSFTSLCGALPSAEANTNPWGYKLSWSPSSLIGASKRTAKVMSDGKEYVWPDGETYEHAYLDEVPKLGSFEVYANANSIVYKEGYSIPEVKSIYRGTYRYPGWCETICYMNQIGFFDTDMRDTKGMTFAQFTARQAGGTGDAKKAFCERFGLRPWSAFIMRMEWIGFFKNEPLPFEKASARDVVSFLFAEKLVFLPDEKDMVILKDEVEFTSKEGIRYNHKSILIDFGIPEKWSSIARTTGVPPAIAARFILDGVIKTPGILMPMAEEVYVPVLAELAKENIIVEESLTQL